ncbi:MAG: hypothetical protein J6U92_04775, partial [Clostridia bacterium]|nr:hypothetical protein [Clostridia bacterium]
DASNVKAHSNYPMRVKLSSDRQARWVNELITELCAKNGITLLDKPQEIQTEEKVANIFERIKGKKDNRTFKERLDVSAEQVKGRYQVITELLGRINGVRVIEAKKSETFKKGNTPIAKLTIKGKTLNAYLGLNPSEYVDTKYIYTDASNVKAHSNYPMRVKLSSDRQARWVNELITDIITNNSLTVQEKPVTVEKKEFTFADLKKKKAKGFKYRLRLSPLAKERFDLIKAELSKIEGVRCIESKSGITYKFKSKPVVKFAVRGKTLNAYLGLNPKDYQDTKYIYTDVSSLSKYKNYAMRVKVSSNRQVKWTLELINAIIRGV